MFNVSLVVIYVCLYIEMKIYKCKKKNKKINCNQNTCKEGTGLINNLINKLPLELHLPGYQFCGPGTKLEERLERGDTGINLLDSACKDHDIAYSKEKELGKRHQADKVLIKKAIERLKAKGASFGEKAAALVVTALMKAKTKLGMGLRKKRHRKKRILKTRKRGGFLPFLLPLLGALGGLGGGAAGIATAVNKAQSNKKLLEETQRHNRAMESSAKGKGLRKKRRRRKKKKGKGLFVGPSQWYQKNYQ